MYSMDGWGGGRGALQPLSPRKTKRGSFFIFLERVEEGLRSTTIPIA